MNILKFCKQRYLWNLNTRAERFTSLRDTSHMCKAVLSRNNIKTWTFWQHLQPSPFSPLPHPLLLLFPVCRVSLADWECQTGRWCPEPSPKASRHKTSEKHHTTGRWKKKVECQMADGTRCGTTLTSMEDEASSMCLLVSDSWTHTHTRTHTQTDTKTNTQWQGNRFWFWMNVNKPK